MKKKKKKRWPTQISNIRPLFSFEIWIKEGEKRQREVLIYIIFFKKKKGKRKDCCIGGGAF